MRGFTDKQCSGVLTAVVVAGLVLAFGAVPAHVQSGSGAPADATSADEPPKRQILEQFSLFYEYFKHDEFESASPYFGWLIENAPGYRAPRNWRRGVTMYEGLAKNASSADTKKAYLDSALVLIDRAVPTLQAENVEVDSTRWTFRKGRFIHSHQDVYGDRRDEVLQAYLETFEENPQMLAPYYVKYIVRQYTQAGDKQKALDFMDRAEQAYDDQELLTWFDRQRDSLFTNPKQRAQFLQRQLKEHPDSLALMQDLFRIYQDLGRTGQVQSLGEQLLERNPTVEVYRLMAEIQQDQGNVDRALEQYEQAVELAESDAERRNLYHSMAQMVLENGRVQQARNYARQALEIDPEYGPAYMTIGDAYATAVQQAPGELGRMDRAVYWLVIDYYRQARQIDPSLAGQADSAIETYREYVPAREDIFFKDWEMGQEMTIDDEPYQWIDETTTVRAPGGTQSASQTDPSE